jgi:hypothetical protein
MPETNRRHPIIDAGELSGQLVWAQRRWPEIHDREELLLMLAAAGAIQREGADRVRGVEESAGALNGVYEPGELEGLREDWPE